MVSRRDAEITEKTEDENMYQNIVRGHPIRPSHVFSATSASLREIILHRSGIRSS